VTAIEELCEVTDGLVAAVGRLVSQLSSTSPLPTRDELEAMVSSPATTLLVARDDFDGEGDKPNGVDRDVVGMLTLAVFRIPTGVRAWIEDVVVDQAARGRGVGEALTLRAIEVAVEAGARTVDLTSRPSREAANRLYRRLGFEARETNVYRYRGDPA
jgi:ribosomal protein S18 acetylase RimI-like enzyme